MTQAVLLYDKSMGEHEDEAKGSDNSDDSRRSEEAAAENYYALLPDDVIFHGIFEFLPIFPFLFSLKKVCRKWSKRIDTLLLRCESLSLLSFDAARANTHPAYCSFTQLHRNYADIN